MNRRDRHLFIGLLRRDTGLDELVNEGVQEPLPYLGWDLSVGCELKFRSLCGWCLNSEHNLIMSHWETLIAQYRGQ